MLKGDFLTNDFDDITGDVMEVQIRRGRTDDLGLLMPGNCTIVLHDPNGKYNPFNTGSALYPNVDVMRPVRIQATYGGTTYNRFYGYIQRIQSSPHLSQQQAIIECTDLFSWLNQCKPTIASTGPTTTGTAIGTILDNSDFNETVFRDLDTGDSISDFSADGSKTSVQLISDLLAAERGVFYISRGGVATYEDRNARYVAPRNTDQSTLIGTIQNLTGAVDVTQIFNEVRVTRTGGTEQVATDSTSIGKYARRVGPSISTGYLASDAVALGLAGHIVKASKDPKQPLTIDIFGNASDAMLTALLSRDLNDRIGASETRGGTSGSFYIESITEQIGAGGTLHRGQWYLSRRPTAVPFLMGYGAIGADYISYLS